MYNGKKCRKENDGRVGINAHKLIRMWYEMASHTTYRHISSQLTRQAFLFISFALLTLALSLCVCVCVRSVFVTMRWRYTHNTVNQVYFCIVSVVVISINFNGVSKEFHWKLEYLFQVSHVHSKCSISGMVRPFLFKFNLNANPNLMFIRHP